MAGHHQQMNLTDKQFENFVSKVNKDGPLPDQSNPHYAGLGKCWIWKDHKLKGGYGQFRVGNSRVAAHRLSYLLKYQKIPEGSCICHRCDNPSCVNPSHLFAGSFKDNSQDRTKKGRNNSPVGTRHGTHKLSNAQVLRIRALLSEGFTGRFLAKEYGVSTSVISEIRTRKLWSHI